MTSAGAQDAAVPVSVLDGWGRFNEPLEGHVDTLYLDTKGLETTADGILCDSPAAACAFAWLRPDGSPASPAEIVAEWNRVKAMRPGLVWTRYRIPSGLHLSADELERVVLARLLADVAVLLRRWPCLLTFPAAALAAIFSLTWGVGPGTSGAGLTGPTWPHFQAAVDQEDWRAAARAGVLSTVNNPGVAPRDLATAVLFYLAAGEELAAARSLAGLVGGPGRPTAAAALTALEAFPFSAAFDPSDTLPSGAPAVEA